MSFSIGDWVFDHWEYDDEADVLYLSIGPPRPSLGERTPEGHVVHFDQDSGEFCGVTVVGARRIWRESNDLAVTIPHRERVESDEDLGAVLA